MTYEVYQGNGDDKAHDAQFVLGKCDTPKGGSALQRLAARLSGSPSMCLMMNKLIFKCKPLTFII
jgi:hypothetical protein